jgi:transcriptional regulator with XRE-family HTH domain
MTAESDYGSRLRRAREGLGLSIEEVTFRVRGRLAKPVSARTIGRLETGTTSEESADEVLVVALCQAYGIDPRDVSEEIAARAERAALVLALYAPRDSNPEPSAVVPNEFDQAAA